MTAGRFLFDAVVAASAALILAWLAGLALRRAPAALRHAVWRIAVLAFWLAPAAAIGADALHLQFCPVPARFAPRVQYERHSPLPLSQLFDLPAWPGAYRPTHPGPRPEPAAIQPPIHPSPFVLVLIAWAAGTMLSAACFVWHLRALTRLLRTTSPVPDAALSKRVAHWSARVGLRGPPTLARSSALTVPTIAGWRKPSEPVAPSPTPAEARLLSGACAASSHRPGPRSYVRRAKPQCFSPPAPSSPSWQRRFCEHSRRR